MNRSNTRQTFSLLAMIAGATLAGCPGKGDPNAQVTAELTANRALWAATGFDSYEYRYRKLCFCSTEAVREVTLRVQDDAVIAGTFIDDGSAVPSAELGDYPTVEGLFAHVEAALADAAEVVTVEYHAALGYPTRIAIDFATGVTDDEITYTASSLVIAP